jgi:predicted nucleic-acid-binding protein
MLVFDTSALIRFFTKDISTQAEKIKNLIETEKKIKIPDVVFPELEYVLLGKTYNVTRNKILTAFYFLASRKNIILSKEVKTAIAIYKKTNLDMADCIIAASARNHTLVSFDKKLCSVKGIKTH